MASPACPCASLQQSWRSSWKDGGGQCGHSLPRSQRGPSGGGAFLKCVCSSPLSIWLPVRGRSEEGRWLRRGLDDDDPPLDQGRLKVLTVLVPSHSPPLLGPRSQATGEPQEGWGVGFDTERLTGFSGGGRTREQMGGRGKIVILRTGPAWPTAVWHIVQELSAASAP